MNEISLADVSGRVGQEVGTSEWITIDQTTVNLFADATHDHQFIHVNPERAAVESPFGGTIAHGFLTLSLLSVMNFSGMPKIREQSMGLNYGFDNVRFMSPVKTGSRVRGRFVLSDCRFRGSSMLVTTYEVTVEIENENRPALTANWITIVQFDPKDRPKTSHS
ncbi:MaoC family dehydratase [Rhizobium ruizarguesonis]|jgi:acyl dehydratase|uniref:MaoC family dehydratase n=1 Tax=Rhizobium ruizarguesonis TaxID=2081791 RepID=A0AAE8PRK6_9HYPH|nr:MaoC family dehydratase [Rhizobium ruizarguesonis]QIO49512.1 MaoC family dehydratase [Rhizobium leguminosarum bv. trifolii]QJS32637.1 MaoC family dehydratase [Rhizobium leguminosarum bv. trifolii TA1]TAT70343.1 MaoC family dehydratase [Rhizobium ruizarguesonis]TAT71675.1 MaoC family dehydratase [Rhizobium ruizarguesonis]TAT81903.1 MaoC family dehydratase [Rhizobium ruizarguesonis]